MIIIILITINIKFYKSKENDEILNSIYYQNIIESQIYVILYIKLNITFTISQLSQFNSYSTQIHLIIIKKYLKYFKYILDMNFIFSESNELVLKIYSNVNWEAGENRKSISGFIFILIDAIISKANDMLHQIPIST